MKSYIKIYESRLLMLSIIAVIIVIGLELCSNQIKILQTRRLEKLKKIAIKKPVRVFQIGFSKCGTTSIAYLFASNGIPSVHHDNGRLPSSIYHNYRQGLPLISDIYKDKLVFTDMEMLYDKRQINVGMNYFKILDAQYPGSKFILNTRDKQAWLKSRSLQPIMPNKDTLLTVNARILQISEDQMLQKWSQDWNSHHTAVLEYFKNRPNDLLVFNIETDSVDKIQDFFCEYYNINTNELPKKNQTKFRKIKSLLGMLHKNRFYQVDMSVW